jgi:hypothetical protein
LSAREGAWAGGKAHVPPAGRDQHQARFQLVAVGGLTHAQTALAGQLSASDCVKMGGMC